MERRRSSSSSFSSPLLSKRELPRQTTWELLRLCPPTGKTRSEATEQEDEQHQHGGTLKCAWILDWKRRGQKSLKKGLHDRMKRAATLERFLKAKYLLDRFIDKQLSRYEPRSHRSSAPIRPGKVAGELMPSSRCRLENSLYWLGDWRPSAIFTLLFLFIRASRFNLRTWQIKVLNRCRQDARIEEAILEEELGEYQATCILRLPFAGAGADFDEDSTCRTETAVHSLQLGLKKIVRIVARAQQLRYRVLELIVKRVLDRTDAAEFLVAFAGIQDMVHHFASCHKRINGPVCISMETFAS
ncbi:uncharacterized protein LOC116253519 [Nymphaea colorata]|nr:uncharacterized protein LOC116253519 [Nymphaea colorata]